MYKAAAVSSWRLFDRLPTLGTTGQLKSECQNRTISTCNVKQETAKKKDENKRSDDSFFFLFFVLYRLINTQTKLAHLQLRNHIGKRNVHLFVSLRITFLICKRIVTRKPTVDRQREVLQSKCTLVHVQNWRWWWWNSVMREGSVHWRAINRLWTTHHDLIEFNFIKILSIKSCVYICSQLGDRFGEWWRGDFIKERERADRARA